MAMRLAVAVVVLVSANAAWAQTAEEVIEKSLAALGGRAAHEKIKSRSMSGTITLGTPAGDIPGTIEITNARPNKTRTLIKADLTSLGAGPLVIDQRFDGQAGYVLDSLQGNRELTGNMLDNMRNTGFPHGFLTYKEQGIVAKLQGKEKVGEREAYVRGLRTHGRFHDSAIHRRAILLANSIHDEGQRAADGRHRTNHRTH